MNILEIRKLFPHIEKGIIYFNHASASPLSFRVQEEIKNYIHNQSVYRIDDIIAMIKESSKAKELFASLINSTPERIAYTDNTSNGLNILAQGIKWKRGDRVLLNDIEFPANVYPFLNLKKKGVIIDFVKSEDKVVDAESIIENIKPRTKLISVSQVQFLSGYRIDLRKIGKVCKERDIIFCVDAAQGLGAVRLDVKEDNIDFISCGSQKWLMGLQGFGFIYVSEELQQNMEPAFVGWLSNKSPSKNLLDYKINLRKTADCFENGTISLVGAFALSASLSLFSDFGFDNVEKKILDNTSYFIFKLKDNGIDTYQSKVKRKFHSGIVSFTHKDPTRIHYELQKENIRFSVREGIVRFSPHFYNSLDEINEVVYYLNQVI
ncbi:MAG: hypothetical protein A2V93_07815 [Ignavibacteria bacterium RBG_16_34_14]|nr:MAG: hypothetical protein A2V93_07815 [Ignavibacteria bacterium RBG_16_34_14]